MEWTYPVWFIVDKKNLVKTELYKKIAVVNGKSYMVQDVTDDFKVTGVFVSSRKLPLEGPVGAVIYLEKKKH